MNDGGAARTINREQVHGERLTGHDTRKRRDLKIISADQPRPRMSLSEPIVSVQRPEDGVQVIEKSRRRKKRPRSEENVATHTTKGMDAPNVLDQLSSAQDKKLMPPTCHRSEARIRYTIKSDTESDRGVEAVARSDTAEDEISDTSDKQSSTRNRVSRGKKRSKRSRAIVHHSRSTEVGRHPAQAQRGRRGSDGKPSIRKDKKFRKLLAAQLNAEKLQQRSVTRRTPAIVTQEETLSDTERAVRFLGPLPKRYDGEFTASHKPLKRNKRVLGNYCAVM
ncbi:hypothetical protein F5Y15DRAFT_46765 [Xylariaceae sp. FL0016]|nr:hypothetical protein F5Y15DRAFT_46765 [Xylariaceae sp. FL0016]